MKIVVFLGPSLDLKDAKNILPEAEYRAPAARGDISKAVSEGFETIGLIDGVFFENSSVGHKEILNAIQSGVTVVGASSMGSLRACEMDEFGMIGIGTVYEMYKTGRIESDDEVAVICDPESNETFSESLVNMRKTFEKAFQNNIVSAEQKEKIISEAKEIYYPDRTFDYVLELAETKKIIASEKKDELETWIKKNKTDIKRDDAILLLEYIKSNKLKK